MKPSVPWPLVKPRTVCEFSAGVVRALVYRIQAQSTSLEVLGFAEMPNPGFSIEKGIRGNVSADAVYAALTQAEKNAGIRNRRVMVNLADPRLEKVEAQGGVELERGTEVFEARHVKWAEKRAWESLNPCDKHLVYRRRAKVIIDGRDAVSDPVGIYGKEMTVVMQLIFSASEWYQEVASVFERVDRKAVGFHPSALASLSSFYRPTDEPKGLVVFLLEEEVTHGIYFRFGAIQDCHSWTGPLEKVLASTNGTRALLEGWDVFGETDVYLSGIGAETRDPRNFRERLGLKKLWVPMPEDCPEPFNRPRYSVVMGLVRLDEAGVRRYLTLPSLKRFVDPFRRRMRHFVEDYF